MSSQQAIESGAGAAPFLSAEGLRVWARWTGRTVWYAALVSGIGCFLVWAFYAVTFYLVVVPLFLLFLALGVGVGRAEEGELSHFGEARRWALVVAWPFALGSVLLGVVTSMNLGPPLFIWVLFVGVVAGVVMAATQVPRLSTILGRKVKFTWLAACVVSSILAPAAGLLVAGPAENMAARLFGADVHPSLWFPTYAEVGAQAAGLFVVCLVGALVFAAVRGLAMAVLLSTPLTESAAEEQGAAIAPPVAAGPDDASLLD